MQESGSLKFLGQETDGPSLFFLAAIIVGAAAAFWLRRKSARDRREGLRSFAITHGFQFDDKANKHLIPISHQSFWTLTRSNSNYNVLHRPSADGQLLIFDYAYRPGKYIVREMEIRRLFSPALRRTLEKMEGVSIDGSKDSIYFRRPKELVPVDNLSKFIGEAESIFRFFGMR